MLGRTYLSYLGIMLRSVRLYVNFYYVHCCSKRTGFWFVRDTPEWAEVMRALKQEEAIMVVRGKGRKARRITVPEENLPAAVLHFQRPDLWMAF